MKKRYFILLLIFSIAIIGISCGFLSNPPQKGMCYATWSRNAFYSEYSDESLEKLIRLGVDHISISPTIYMNSPYSTDIFATEKTPSDASLEHVIARSKSLGLKIMVKPHVDVLHESVDPYSRADIGFSTSSEWDIWFLNYKRHLFHYADMAEKFGVEYFCVGTELATTTHRHPELWEQLIREVREHFSGKLIYAANWDNYMNVTFWDKLDYVGIDAYFPLTDEPDPSIADLVQGWKKWKSEIRAFYSRTKKPILFTEIGYASTAHAAIRPWENGYTGSADIEIQKKCYEAFYRTIWGSKWLKGVYWWVWDTNIRSGGKHNRNFTPQNKPAQAIIKKYYKK